MQLRSLGIVFSVRGKRYLKKFLVLELQGMGGCLFRWDGHHFRGNEVGDAVAKDSGPLRETCGDHPAQRPRTGLWAAWPIASTSTVTAMDIYIAGVLTWQMAAHAETSHPRKDGIGVYKGFVM